MSMLVANKVTEPIPVALSTVKKAYFGDDRKPLLNRVNYIRATDIDQLPRRFYNIEGEGMMREDTEHYRDNVRAIDLRNRDSQMVSDTKNYQSWLASYAFFGEDDWFQNIVGNEGRKIVPRRVWKTTLLPEESFHAGCFEKTRAKCLKVRELSRKQRATNKSSTGKLKLVHSSGLPTNWEAAMSTQESLEGCESRRRPPTVVQLLASEYITSPSRHISKFKENTSTVAITNVEVRTEASNEGVVRTSPIKSKLSVLVQKELEISQTILQDTEAKRKYLENPFKPSTDVDHLHYYNWLRNPDNARQLQFLLYDPINTPSYTLEQLTKFNKAIDEIDRKYEQYTDRNDLWRYDNWLRSRDWQFTLVGKPYSAIPERVWPQIKNTAISYGLLKSYTNMRLTNGRIGLDTMPPMTDLEYDNITREEPSSIDKHLLTIGQISEGQYCTGDTANKFEIDRSYVMQDRANEFTFLNTLFRSTSSEDVKPPWSAPEDFKTEAPAITTVDGDVKKSLEDYSNLELVKAGSKVAWNWFIKKMTDV